MLSLSRIGRLALVALILVTFTATANAQKLPAHNTKQVSQQVWNQRLLPDEDTPEDVAFRRFVEPAPDMIAGDGLTRTVRRAAKVGSIWDSQSTSIDDVRPIPVQDPAQYYGGPALLSLANGDVALAYTEYGWWDTRVSDPIKKPKVWFTGTADGGETWQDPVLVAEGEHGTDFRYMTLVRTASGRLLIMPGNPASTTQDLYYSDDDGATWKVASIESLTGQTPRLHGPLGGELWQPFRDLNDGSLKYRASTNGLAWSEHRLMLENPSPESPLVAYGIVEPAPGKLVAMLGRWDWDRFEYTAAITRSSDGGGTWSDFEIIDTTVPVDPPLPGSIVYSGPSFGRLRLSPSGQLGFVFQDPLCTWCAWGMNPPVDIFFMSSDDLGSTWSAPIRFTSFVGNDFHPDLAYVGDTPIVVFATDRFTPIQTDPHWGLPYSHLWYGVSGVSTEGPGALPPRTDFISFGVTPAGPETPLQLVAQDETAVSSVTLRLTSETEPPVEKPLFDDGQHSDWEAADGVWGNTFELALGAAYDLTATATDSDGIVAENFTDIPTTIPTHYTGNLYLGVGDDNHIGIVQWTGNPAANLSWPTRDDPGHLFEGHFFVATDQAPGATSPVILGPRALQTIDDGVSVDNEGERFTVGLRDVPDNQGDPRPLGLLVEQKSDSYNRLAPNGSGFIVFEYSIRNESDHDLENLVVGLRVDLDLPIGIPPRNPVAPLVGGYFYPMPFQYGEGDPHDDDLACYDEQGKILYQFDSGFDCSIEGYTCPSIHIGFAVLSDSVHTAALWGAESDPQREDWLLITSGIDPLVQCDVLPDPDDYVLVLTAQPFALASGETVTKTFGIVVGDGKQEMLDNAATMRAVHEKFTGIDGGLDPSLPLDYALLQNYPNPFNPVTSVDFELPRSDLVTLKIYDLLGRETVTLFDGRLGPGRHRYTWNAADHPSGVYFYRLSAGDFSATRKLVLQR